MRALGAVPGGQGLLLPGNERLVVDPATGRVNRTSMYVTPDGAVMSGTKDTETITVGAEWTNSLPQ